MFARLYYVYKFVLCTYNPINPAGYDYFHRAESLVSRKGTQMKEATRQPMMSPVGEGTIEASMELSVIWFDLIVQKDVLFYQITGYQK